MTQPARILLAIIVPLLVVDGTTSASAAWKAGWSSVVITPDTPMPMAGYAGRGADHATGKLTELWAKILIIEDERGHQGCVITMDVVGIDRALSVSLCERLMIQQGWDRRQIAICTSHTHTGPVINKNLRPMHYLMFDEENQKLVEDYAKAIETKIANAVKEASKVMKPVELKAGSGRATFAVNRRNNREADVPMLREKGMLQGPFDHDVPVLAVVHDDEVKVALFGYACHCTVLSFMEWSGDYAGFAQINLEEKHDGLQAMFWAGCGADQNPLPRRTVELAKEYGGRLASAVSETLESGLTPVSSSLSTAYEEIALPLGELPTREQLVSDTQADNKYVKSRAEYLLKQVDGGTPLSQSYPYPVQLWTLGKDIHFVVLGGEVVVDYAIRLKMELASDSTPETNIWCAGYANDVMAYIPSLRVLREGGYEGAGAMVYYGLPTAWGEDVEELIIAKVKELRDENE
ncbi:MAG: neutral/alkaline non-lysosomal ceramidase N-terminal domain-containing protein [Planctomycetaceae bacterium]|nr:neutral/alkaline non-lysosomal ceramidase N-terminal domain-containing protein [Planctomycetaceae bacterium]